MSAGPDVRAEYRGPRAVLWDMDGTLVDSEPVWWETEIRVVTAFGGRWTVADCETMVGSSLPVSLDAWMSRISPGTVTRQALAERVYSEITRRLKDGVRFQPGAFTTSVAGDEVARGKPDPEPYLRAAAELGVPATECVVLEDSPSGAAAGNSAGALVVVVPQAVAVTPARRRVHVRTLAGLTPGRLGDLLAAAGRADPGGARRPDPPDG